MDFITPPALKPGDTIGVMAPSSYVERDDIEASARRLEKRGYKVFIHPQTYEREHQSAGNHLQKSLALQGLWQRKDIQAIWTAGGGNRVMHLLDTINFDKMKDTPKALIGFSDVTALLNALSARTDIMSFHGPVFKQIKDMKEAQLDQLFALLEGRSKDAEIPMKDAVIVRQGETDGHLVGGCLSVFQYLAGSKDCPALDDAILFLEDTSDHISRFDRMFLHLKRMGVFEKISGLVIGEFHDVQDGQRPFGLSLKEIILEHVQDTNFPIVMNAPFGHGDRLFSLPLGQKCRFEVKTESIRLDFL